MFNNRPNVLECQLCGTVLKVLTLEEEQRVADNPENFIVYCTYCAYEILLDIRTRDL